MRSDFFPVVLTFLRQLPVIGTFLSLPYIGSVRVPCFLCAPPLPLTLLQALDRLAGSRQSIV